MSPRETDPLIRRSTLALGYFIAHAPADLVGEFLRWQTFVGEGFGCYSNFEVRADARKWSEAEKVRYWMTTGGAEDREQALEWGAMGDGYEFLLDELSVDAVWFWDGDGCLEFAVYDREGQAIRRLSNSDCKKDYVWGENGA